MVVFFSYALVGDIWRKPLIELTKLAKISREAFSYGAIPDPFLHLRNLKMDQMKGIDAMKKLMPGKKVAYVGGRYLKKTLI